MTPYFLADFFAGATGLFDTGCFDGEDFTGSVMDAGYEFRGTLSGINRILGIEANTSVAIYNSLGELVKVVSASENQEINVRDLAAGLYMLHFGNATLRFVKEQ